jgi:hypothetical protein
MTRTIRTPAIAALLGLTMLGGCAKWSTAYRSGNVAPDRPSVVTVDAKQRHLLMVPNYELDANGKVTKVSGMRVCAEAAPDVFSALAASGKLDIGVDAKSAAQVNLGAAAAATETAAAIRRTQTVNLARESFYRTCERYLSGALEKSAFGVQAARDYRQAIAMLAIEQLTGVVHGPATIIGPGTTNAQGQQGRNAALEDSKTELADAAAAEKRANTAKDAACKDAEGGDEKCAEATRLATEATTRTSAASEKYDKAQKTSGPSGTSGSASTGGITVSSDNSTSTTQPENVAAVAVAVTSIVREVMRTDESLMFCLQLLQSKSASDGNSLYNRKVFDGRKSNGANSLVDACLQAIGRKAVSEAAELIPANKARFDSVNDINTEMLFILGSIKLEKFSAASKILRDNLDKGLCLTADNKPQDKADCIAALATPGALSGINIEKTLSNWPIVKEKLIELSEREQ